MSEKADLERDKAIELITEKKIARIKGAPSDMFVVSGFNDEYLVMKDNFCTCDHFILRCLKSEGMICYHILAVNLSGKITKEMDIDWMDFLLREH